MAGALSRAGREVTLIVRPDALAHHPHALHVDSATFGQFTAPVRVAASLDDPVDAVWVTVKATQLEAAVQSMTRDQLGSGVVVPLLNGIDHVNLLRQRYGHDRVVPGTIRVESERRGPGRIAHLSPFVMVELASGLALCAELREAGVACALADDEATMLWQKLVLLAPMALATAASGHDVGGVRGDPTWRRRLEAAADEACAVAAAEGATVDAGAMKELLLERMPGNMRTSMQKDIESRRPPELDAIAGPILRVGAAHGIDTPATRELAALVEVRTRA